MEQQLIAIVIEAFKIICSTFIGGFAAIQFESRRHRRLENDNIYSILIKTQTAFITQRNILLDLDNMYIIHGDISNCRNGRAYCILVS